MKTNDLMIFVKLAAIAGNILFVLWILFNAIDEGFSGTLPEKASAIGMICLLALNSFLILNKGQQKQFTNQ